MQHKIIFIIFFIVMLTMPGMVQSDPLYVTDEFRVDMRTGPSLQHRITNMLPSGTSLEVLDESSDWFLIRTFDGREGWIMKQYVMQRKPREMMVRQLEDKVSELQDRAGSSEQKAAVLDQENADLRAELNNLQQEFNYLRQRYLTLQEDSGNIEGIKQELELTSNALEQDREQLLRLRRENQELRSQNNLHWFLAGGGAMGFTALIGFVLGRIQRRKRTYL